MTEERMIRVSIDQWQDMFEGKSLTWNELSMILFGSEFELGTPSFYDLEPAPPKDWKPYCFKQRIDGKCFGMCHPIADDEMADCCLECPFRK